MEQQRSLFCVLCLVRMFVSQVGNLSISADTQGRAINMPKIPVPRMNNRDEGILVVDFTPNMCAMSFHPGAIELDLYRALMIHFSISHRQRQFKLSLNGKDRKKSEIHFHLARLELLFKKLCVSFFLIIGSKQQAKRAHFDDDEQHDECCSIENVINIAR